MTSALVNRLNQIEEHITATSFLSSEGIGNEIACYIFDYSAEDELQVRSHITMMMKGLESNRNDLKVLHLDLFDVVMGHLKERKLFEKALKMEQAKGDAAALKALRGPLAAEKIRDAIAKVHNPANYDLVLLSGVGSVWPALRAHSLLNCLHSIMGSTPLVMFYPGNFDGTTLSLFGQIDSHTRAAGKHHYYRAFSLIPRETQS